jgi:hypothetical protein
MGKLMTVGHSYRTALKHDLMRDLVNQEVGAAGNIDWISRLVWLDLTAGDASPHHDGLWYQAVSPGILARAAMSSRKPLYIGLYEIDTSTYGELLSNLAAQLTVLKYDRTGDACWRFGDLVTLQAFNADGKEARTDLICKGDAVLVLNDPNAITGWAMRDSFAQEIVSRATAFRSFSTLGCNVSGIKRTPLVTPGALPLDDPDFMSPTERRNWFELVGAQERATPQSRDLLLVAIERDSAQWAYLISTAVKWREKTEVRVRSAFERAEFSADMAWAKQDPENFTRIKEVLFLTKAERREAMYPPLWKEGDGVLPAASA